MQWYTDVQIVRITSRQNMPREREFSFILCVILQTANQHTALATHHIPCGSLDATDKDNEGKEEGDGEIEQDKVVHLGNDLSPTGREGEGKSGEERGGEGSGGERRGISKQACV